jgi:hypothetical protein
LKWNLKTIIQKTPTSIEKKGAEKDPVWEMNECNGR